MSPAIKLDPDALHARIQKLEDKANVEAFVILDATGQHIGTVRFHLPKDGAGRLTCSAADWSLAIPADAQEREKWTRWQLGWANGYGYDKRTAAMGGMTIGTVTLADQGRRWDAQLQAAGYRVIQSV
jgi:hypothetical protein